jgi:hypothetical protein
MCPNVIVRPFLRHTSTRVLERNSALAHYEYLDPLREFSYHCSGSSGKYARPLVQLCSFYKLIIEKGHSRSGICTNHSSLHYDVT